MEQITVYAFPVFLLLMLVELGYGLAIGRNTYRLSDALASLSQGLLSQLVASVSALFQIGLYALTWRHLALFPRAALWNSVWGWLLAIVMFDFCDYWLHRVGHESAVFWAAHAVHHQSQDFNLSTALRQESTVAFLGWPFYLPMALAGVAPAQFALAGLIVLLYQFWIHTEHIGKLGWFDRVFSSPSNHRVHHAVNDQYLDKNYGGMLIIWDRLFGTFAVEEEAPIYGTRTPLNSWNPLWAVVSGYVPLWQLACQAPRWQDKFKVWFKPPGWLPAGVVDNSPAFDLQRARQRFDLPLTRSSMALALLQFVLLTAAGAAYLWQADGLDTLHLWAFALLLVAGLMGLGSLLQRRLAVAGLLLLDALLLLAAWLL
ncbi:sterol desaturase family protein [Aquitalea aquatica]|uniref:Sterol desaturase family protein n=1 Tax=Aquitalea aquatica TaxID=3044273 RepID=A0A838Y4S9_9NEIS|nr:sterol desaturase family protein [Aquitalea magnusonii]MBA4709706.1 sterol desaturase family protein [Aquitalea magnusonii]